MRCIIAALAVHRRSFRQQKCRISGSPYLNTIHCCHSLLIRLLSCAEGKQVGFFLACLPSLRLSLLWNSSMSKPSKAYDKEYMKMAMLKHEETFKHQVHELHRLYRVQKVLMKETEAKKTSSNANVEVWNAEDDKEAALELTLATGCRVKKKKEDDTSFTSDSGGSFSWSSTESSGMKKAEQGKQDRRNRQLLRFLQC
ncbi:hypothetical protein HPP92_007658 [Vanilla planifolia]|uniref:Uncharacterized protein n=1 Tax=Vanilla planifolia TaxID=51239 RepID=A0A835VBG0_VANPL|nr:hypothetical protein HPP92_007856 [Vanilla planifolia]KAG0490795.1 hypothetical protein HPP92_007658 [Vanilla planifolia]